MVEICFCGWSGDVTAKTPDYLGDGQWGLTCPGCGRPDDLTWLPGDAALFTFALACQHHEQQTAGSTVPVPLPSSASERAA